MHYEKKSAKTLAALELEYQMATRVICSSFEYQELKI
jgi:hypothetical protein